MTPARSVLVAIVAVVLLAALPVARAEEQFPSGLMSATPTTPQGGRTCTIDVRPVSFGNYDPLQGSAVDALGYVIYVCGNIGASSTAPGGNAIRIEMTTGSANTFSPRTMVGPDNAQQLEYNLYLDPTHRTVWGQGAFGTDVYVDSSPPNRTPVTVPVYGRILERQDVPAGSYIDGVTARIVF